MVRGFFSLLVFSLLCFVQAQTASAQFSRGKMGINGLTCSQCSRSVEMELRKLPFLDNIAMNLEHTTCTFTIKDESKFSVFALRDAVRNAGFSVRFLRLEHKGARADTLPCFRHNNVVYQFITSSEPAGDRRLYQVLAADFMPAREWKKVAVENNSACKGRDRVFLRAASAR